MKFQKQTLTKNRADHQHLIRHLQKHDAYFVEVFDSYHELESEVHNIEKCNSHVIDVYMQSLKQRRIQLKNELFDIIHKAERALLSKTLVRSIRSLHVGET